MQPKHSPQMHVPFYKRTWFPFTVLSVVIFLLTFCFFYSIHPLVIFDTDDWAYLTYPREALPVPAGWNPTRVFPEVVMPIASAFAGYVVAPFMGGSYLDAIIWTNALVAALFITVYVGAFTAFIKKQFDLKVAWSIMLGCLFFLMHFLVLRGLPEDNMHLFWSVNVTSFYFYVLPNVFCAALLLYAITSGIFDNFFKPEHLVKKSMIFLAVYLALFSNLFASIMLAAFGGVLLVVRLGKEMKKGFDLKQYCSFNAAWLIFIVAWFMVQLLEATGGRAASLEGGLSFGERLQVTINLMTTLPLSKAFCALFIVALVFYVVAVIRHRDDERKNNFGIPIALFFAGLLSLVYTVLVVAKADPTYIVRADCIFPVLFFMVMIAMTCCAIAVKCFPRVTLFLPLLALLVVFHIYTNGNTFKDINVADLPPEKSYAVTQDIIDQLEQADESGQTTMELKVPASHASDNWPFALYAGEQNYFSRTALKMGLIADDIEVTVVPDPTKNTQFDLNTERFV